MMDANHTDHADLRRQVSLYIMRTISDNSRNLTWGLTPLLSYSGKSACVLRGRLLLYIKNQCKSGGSVLSVSIVSLFYVALSLKCATCLVI